MASNDMIEQSGIKQLLAYVEIKLAELEKLRSSKLNLSSSPTDAITRDFEQLSELKLACENLKSNSSTSLKYYKAQLAAILAKFHFSNSTELQDAINVFKTKDNFIQEKIDRNAVIESSGINAIIGLLEHKKSKHRQAFLPFEPFLEQLKQLKQEIECNPLLTKELSQNRLFGLLNQGHDFSQLSASWITPKLIGSHLQRTFNALKEDVGNLVDFRLKGHDFFSQRGSDSSSADLPQNKKGA